MERLAPDQSKDEIPGQSQDQNDSDSEYLND